LTKSEPSSEAVKALCLASFVIAGTNIQNAYHAITVAIGKALALMAAFGLKRWAAVKA
jgi:hypothetical protein